MMKFLTRLYIFATALILAAAGYAEAQTTMQLGAGQVIGNSTAARAPGQAASVTSIFDRAFGSTANSMLYRGASTWGVLASGNNLVLTTGGTGTPAWAATLPATNMPALTGDVTTSAGAVATTLASIISAGGPTGSATVAPIITYDAKGRLTAVSSATIQPSAATTTLQLDSLTSCNVQGDLLYRNATTWVCLGPGLSGQVLQSGGAAANPSWLTVTGTGTVTSVGFTGGLISVANGTTTPAFTVAGTSGGIPYFSSASTWASSAALTANLPVIGGGAGVAPTVGTRSGNTTAFATVTGTLTSGRCVQIDASGNFVQASAACQSGTVTSVATNNGLTGGTITTTGTIGLATIAADNVLMNSTGSTAVPVATAVGSCSGASSALTYNTSTHAFGCNTISGGSGGLVSKVTYTTTQTVTIPVGATKAMVRLWGGAGGGGGAAAGSSQGGAGGGYLEKYLTSLTPGNTLALTVGAAGTAGGTSTSDGGAGGNSTLASGTQSISTLTANGGTGGARDGTGGGCAVATGGSASGGDVNISGVGATANCDWGATVTFASAGGATGGGMGRGGDGGRNPAVGGLVGTAGGMTVEWYQ